MIEIARTALSPALLARGRGGLAPPPHDLSHRETLEILGIHCFGDQASEIIHIGQAIMSQPAPHNRVTWFVEATFNYPTMAEAYRVAALNGYNRLF